MSIQPQFIDTLRQFRELHPVQDLYIGSDRWEFQESGQGSNTVVIVGGGGSTAESMLPVNLALSSHARVISIGLPAKAMSIDEVEARSSATGKLEAEPVTALTPIHKDSLFEIRIEGERLPLRPSTHHPFWARHGDQPAQWINSSDLRIGDRLFTMDGNWRAITAIAPVAGEETVYNFTVDKDHDYFVGETGFLVHNAKSCNCQPNSPAQLYALYDGFGNFLKWGISVFAGGRYSGPTLQGLGGAPPPQVVLEGTRREMLDMEDMLIKCAPGPLNMEKRAGSFWR